MKLRFNSKINDNAEFERAYQSEIEKKVMPRWFRVLAGLALLGGIGAIGHAIFDDSGRLIGLYLSVALFVWLWSVGYSRCYLRFYARYFQDSEGRAECVVELADGRFTTETRGIRTSFPLAALSMAYERDDVVYLYFGKLGAGRIPFAAFDSDDQRRAFMELVNSKKEVPNAEQRSASP